MSLLTPELSDAIISLIDERIGQRKGPRAQQFEEHYGTIFSDEGDGKYTVRLFTGQVEYGIVAPTWMVLSEGDTVRVRWQGRDRYIDTNFTQAPITGGGGGGVTDHGALTGLTDDDHTQYQLESEKGAANGYAGLNGSGYVDPSDLGSGDTDQWTGLGGDGAWANRWRVWGPTSSVSAPTQTAVDSGFSFTYTASDTSFAFDLFIMHNRQASGGGLRFQWQNTTGNSGGNMRGLLEMGLSATHSWNDALTVNTTDYDTWYGGAVPSTNNSVRYGRWKGRLLLPTSGTFPGTIKLRISSVASAEALLVEGSWLQYAKF